MQRVVEPELMDDEEQARAYAEADFEEAHTRFVSLAGEFLGTDAGGYVLDLGCGPGDITFRFARAHPRCIVHGVDGSPAMLRQGRKILASCPDIVDRVELIEGMLPGAALPRERYDAVISNSLLHHLHDPGVLWHVVEERARPGARVFIMDLLRPESKARARELVGMYAEGEPPVLKRDFYNSLLAAFEVGEIEGQLAGAGLSDLEVSVVSDRHLVVKGTAPR